ncbi:MAG: AtpZ/AtpI family protein [Dehalococcoidia bacterium]|nr:MAG: AtpZ/AtpI family protein [Dehalococcoidia bacterium]
MVAALRLVGVGFFIGGAIVAGVMGGLFLDNRLGTRPFLTLAGLFIGLLVAFIGVYQMLLPLLKNSNNNKKENG